MEEELIERALKAQSPDEILEIAASSSIDVTREEAERIYNEIHKNGEMGDDELEAVSGGCSIGSIGAVKRVVGIGVEAVRRYRDKDKDNT